MSTEAFLQHVDTRYRRLSVSRGQEWYGVSEFLAGDAWCRLLEVWWLKSVTLDRFVSEQHVASYVSRCYSNQLINKRREWFDPRRIDRSGRSGALSRSPAAEALPPGDDEWVSPSLRAAFESCTEKQRVAVEVTVLGRLSATDAAELLGVGISTINQNKRTGLSQIRARYEGRWVCGKHRRAVGLRAAASRYALACP